MSKATRAPSSPNPFNSHPRHKMLQRVRVSCSGRAGGGRTRALRTGRQRCGPKRLETIKHKSRGSRHPQLRQRRCRTQRKRRQGRSHLLMPAKVPLAWPRNEPSANLAANYGVGDFNLHHGWEISQAFSRRYIVDHQSRIRSTARRAKDGISGPP